MKIIIKTSNAKILKEKILQDAIDGTLNTWEHRKTIKTNSLPIVQSNG